jgi:hypothetical protein
MLFKWLNNKELYNQELISFCITEFMLLVSVYTLTAPCEIDILPPIRFLFALAAETSYGEFLLHAVPCSDGAQLRGYRHLLSGR